MITIVTGGAGYIGSHVVSQLCEQGEQVVIVDDLSSGLITRVPGMNVHQIDMSTDGSISELHKLAVDYHADSIIHFAAKKSAPESVSRPEYYFRQNIGSLMNVIKAIQGTAIDKFVFSSSAAVYGDAKDSVVESAPTQPLNPYGESKLMGERILKCESDLGAMRVACLRYFNVAGSGSDNKGDNSVHNLIPMVFEKISEGRVPLIFGDKYDTPDGSCIRDYIHVVDLAAAHIAALKYLNSTNLDFSTFNIGTGAGYSVKEVLQVVKSVTNFAGEAQVVSPREGDPARIVGDVTAAEKFLGWKAENGLQEMVESAWSAHLYSRS